MKSLNSIEEILADIAAGRMVVIMDDEDRENEGDLLMAAQKVTASDINFMARFGRGLICLTLTAERCRQLRLPLMVSETHREHRTTIARTPCSPPWRPTRVPRICASPGTSFR